MFDVQFMSVPTKQRIIFLLNRKIKKDLLTKKNF